jgi:acyl-coenzyme A thioesterase PaaI-like protein
MEVPMIATALDNFTAPPSSQLLGWHLIDARPTDGWIRIGFDGKTAFCNPAGFVQGGILSAMLDDTMGPAVFVMTDGRLYTATISLTVNFAFVAGKLTTEGGTLLATATANARLIETAKAIR